MGIVMRTIGAVALCLGLVACARGAKSNGATARAPEKTTVRVENQGFADMTIYVFAGGQRVRLGMATGNSTSTFTLPAYLVGGLQTMRFIADPVGSDRAPVSDEITVQPGDQVELTIPPR
ncbi:MAG TPA: hypothetical protein VIQ60_07810 [Gemmatimonadaceae bacterium]